MQNTDPTQDTKRYNILEQSLIINLIGFFLLLILIFGISLTVFYFVSLSIPPTNLALTNILIGSTITLTLGSLIGAVNYVTVSMTSQLNSRIDNAFSEAKLLAMQNQNEAKLLAIQNQAKLEASLSKVETSQAKLETLIADLRADLEKSNAINPKRSKK